MQRQLPTKSCSKAKQWLAESVVLANTKAVTGVNHDNNKTCNKRFLDSCRTNALRVAISLGMLLGMSHGWVTAEALQTSAPPAINDLEIVKSDTSFGPFGSDSNKFFPY